MMAQQETPTSAPSHVWHLLRQRRSALGMKPAAPTLHCLQSMHQGVCRLAPTTNAPSPQTPRATAGAAAGAHDAAAILGTATDSPPTRWLIWLQGTGGRGAHVGANQIHVTASADKLARQGPRPRTGQPVACAASSACRRGPDSPVMRQPCNSGVKFRAEAHASEGAPQARHKRGVGAVFDRLLTYERLKLQPPVHKGLGLLNHTEKRELSTHGRMGFPDPASHARPPAVFGGAVELHWCKWATSNLGLALERLAI